MPNPATRRCPIPGCQGKMSSTQCLCKYHWFQVPVDIRNRVWREYRKWPGSPEHFSVVREAINSVIEGQL